MIKRSIVLRVLPMVASVAMLSACAHSPEAKVALTPDPIVEQRTVTRLICPAEVSAALPEKVSTPAGMVADLAADVAQWLASHLRREALLERRLVDAKAQCP